MFFDAEMLLIYAIAVLSGVVFYTVASRDPAKDNAQDNLTGLCDSPQ